MDIKSEFKERYGGDSPEITMKSKLLEFISIKKEPREEDFGDFAHRFGYDFEDVVFSLGQLVRELSVGIGKHNNVSDDSFDQVQLVIGEKIELEHTDSKVIARSIAKDHLSEIKDYYTRLVKMEREAE